MVGDNVRALSRIANYVLSIDSSGLKISVQTETMLTRILAVTKKKKSILDNFALFIVQLSMTVVAGKSMYGSTVQQAYMQWMILVCCQWLDRVTTSNARSAAASQCTYKLTILPASLLPVPGPLVKGASVPAAYIYPL